MQVQNNPRGSPGPKPGPTPSQTVDGKEQSNPLMAGVLPKNTKWQSRAQSLDLLHLKR